MKCQQLAHRVEKRFSETDPSEIARFCLLLVNKIEDLSTLEDDGQLDDALKQMQMKVRVAADQHAAMTRELEELAQSDPRKFQPDQVWILIRAIKVQSQILEMYLGQPALDV